MRGASVLRPGMAVARSASRAFVASLVASGARWLYTPAVVRVLGDAGGAAHLDHGVPLSQFHLRLTQHADDLFRCVSLTTLAALPSQAPIRADSSQTP